MKRMSSCQIRIPVTQIRIPQRTFTHHRLPVRVKICCISSIEELNQAVDRGVHAVGLVSHMPSGPGVIPEEMISNIAKRVPPGVASFLLTSSKDPHQIIDQQKRTRVNTIQICDALSSLADYHILRKELPGVSLVQVIHVADDNAIEEALSVRDLIDGILLDSGRPNLAVKELGGTGRVHDWKVSKKIVDTMKAHSKPVFLAGGLKPSNVREAIELVKPYGLDICSGVRTNGKLDVEKLNEFLDQIRY